MLGMAALTYGAVASFVLSSAGRNARSQRPNPPQVSLPGWLLMSFSGTTGVILLGYAGAHALA